jgi:hypothetical protein
VIKCARFLGDDKQTGERDQLPHEERHPAHQSYLVHRPFSGLHPHQVGDTMSSIVIRYRVHAGPDPTIHAFRIRIVCQVLHMLENQNFFVLL